MKKVFLSLAVAASLMSCGGGQTNSQNNQETDSSAVENQEVAVESSCVLKQIFKASPSEWFVNKNSKEIETLFAQAIDSIAATSPDTKNCEASFECENGLDLVRMIACPKSDGANFLCVVQHFESYDNLSLVFQKVFNFDSKTGEVSDKEISFEALDVAEFGNLSKNTVKSIQKLIDSNGLSFVAKLLTEGVPQPTFVLDFIIPDEVCNNMTEDDFMTVENVYRYWNGETFAKQQ